MADPAFTVVPDSLPQAGGAAGALPIAGQPQPALRSDAVRNRERVLCAARRVVEQHGANGLTMDAVAHEAGVGKGTVFRRFGDRSSLLHALIDEDERRFQDRVLGGPPPLGPGAPAHERLQAYGDALLDHLDLHKDLLAEAEGPSPEIAHPVELAKRMHLSYLLREIGHPPQTAAALAAALQGFLSGSRVYRLRSIEGFELDDLRAAWRVLAAGVAQPAA